MAGIEFIIAWIFEFVRPGFVGIGVGGRTLAVEMFGVEAWGVENRIAPGVAIDSRKVRPGCFSAPFGSISSSAAGSSGLPTRVRA